MIFKNKKEAVIIPFPTQGNVVPLTEHRLKRGSPQILTEVVASEADHSAQGIELSIAGPLVRQVVPISELSGVPEQKNTTPPDDLIA